MPEAAHWCLRHRLLFLPALCGVLLSLLGHELHASAVSVVGMGLLFFSAGALFQAYRTVPHRHVAAFDLLAGELDRRSPTDESALQRGGYPDELAPVLNALDALFARLRYAVSTERRFTWMAAHELRTPLAGIRAQAQLASWTSNHAEAYPMLLDLTRAVDSATHLLDQLLDLTRVEEMSSQGAQGAGPVFVAAVFQDIAAELAFQARLKRISIVTRFDAPEIHCAEFGLSLVLKNLLTNAVMYSPFDRSVHVTTEIRPSQAVLIVDDAGPGIPPEGRQRAFEKFNRLERNDVNGLGLGLPIVAHVVRLHRGTVLLLDAPGGGLRVEVSFPQPHRSDTSD